MQVFLECKLKRDRFSFLHRKKQQDFCIRFNEEHLKWKYGWWIQSEQVNFIVVLQVIYCKGFCRMYGSTFRVF